MGWDPIPYMTETEKPLGFLNLFHTGTLPVNIKTDIVKFALEQPKSEEDAHYIIGYIHGRTTFMGKPPARQFGETHVYLDEYFLGWKDGKADEEREKDERRKGKDERD